MMKPEQVEDAAARLFEAERDRRQIRLLSLDFPDATMDDAYLVQAALVKRKITSGLTIKGWKIGLTSKARQAASKINEPDFGYLFDDLLLQDGAKVPFASFCVPRVEPAGAA